MTKVTLLPIRSNYASAQALNENFQRIAEALDKTLSRSGEVPNQMESDLDMNGYTIFNWNQLQDILDRLDALEAKVG